MGILSEAKKNRETHPDYFNQVFGDKGVYTPKTVALLRDMASALRRYGWIQENYGSCKKGFCLVGALGFCLVGALEEESGSHTAWNTASDLPSVDVMNALSELEASVRHALSELEASELEASVRRAFWEFGPLELGNAPIHWNDQPEREADEVVSMIEEVAQAVEDKLLAEVTV